MKFADWDRFEREFGEAVARLPNYKRGAAWEYVKKLQARIEELESELSAQGDVLGNIADERDSLLAFKASVDEALNSGDGSYKP